MKLSLNIILRNKAYLFGIKGWLHVIIITTFIMPTYSQEAEMNYTYVEDYSYSLYQAENWDSLVEFGEDAIKALERSGPRDDSS